MRVFWNILESHNTVNNSNHLVGAQPITEILIIHTLITTITTTEWY